MDVSSGPTIAIIGAGSAGRGFAEICALAGFRVVLEDVMPANLRRAEERFAALGRDVQLVSTVEDAVRDADIAVDFVPDELESKLEIWSLIDRMAPPKTVMCTPSEVLSITDLASCTYRGDRCVMVRGMLRGEIGAKVRILTARGTSAATRDAMVQLFERLGAIVEAEHDPDLPMLLKNMNAATL
jgi:3-hydroxybutyryl-CoA dehydrogenase